MARAQSAPGPAPDALGAYEEHALGVRNLRLPGRDLTVAADRQQWMYGPCTWDAFRGPDHHPISEEAFYRIVGGDDLLSRYEHKARIRKGLAIGGGVLLLGGAIFAAIAEVRRSAGFGEPACTGAPCASLPSPGPSPKWGFAIAGSGLVSLIVSGLIHPTPIDADEADRLARDYDQSLRCRLGLTDTARP
ncbi:MAG TPA: hypothetical protein VI456_01095 [Polyangia bacterium]